jgi:hypothetical protein
VEFASKYTAFLPAGQEVNYEIPSSTYRVRTQIRTEHFLLYTLAHYSDNRYQFTTPTALNITQLASSHSVLMKLVKAN